MAETNDSSPITHQNGFEGDSDSESEVTDKPKDKVTSELKYVEIPPPNFVFTFNTSTPLQSSKCKSPDRGVGRRRGKGSRGRGQARTHQHTIPSFKSEPDFVEECITSVLQQQQLQLSPRTPTQTYLPRETLINLTSHISNGFVYISHAFELIKQSQLELDLARQALEVIYQNQNPTDTSCTPVDPQGMDYSNDSVPGPDQAHWNESPPERFQVALDPYQIIDGPPENEVLAETKSSRGRRNQKREAGVVIPKQRRGRGKGKGNTQNGGWSNYDSVLASTGVKNMCQHIEETTTHSKGIALPVSYVSVEDVKPHMEKAKLGSHSFSAKQVKRNLEKANKKVSSRSHQNRKLAISTVYSKMNGDLDPVEQNMQQESKILNNEIEFDCDTKTRKRKLPASHSSQQVPKWKQLRCNGEVLDRIKNRVKSVKDDGKSSSESKSSDDSDSRDTVLLPTETNDEDKIRNIPTPSTIVSSKSSSTEPEVDSGTVVQVSGKCESGNDENVFSLVAGKDMCGCEETGNSDDSKSDKSQSDRENNLVSRRADRGNKGNKLKKAAMEDSARFKGRSISELANANVANTLELSKISDEGDNDARGKKQSFSSGFGEDNSPVHNVAMEEEVEDVEEDDDFNDNSSVTTKSSLGFDEPRDKLDEDEDLFKDY